jgi:hypothetical protein
MAQLGTPVSIVMTKDDWPQCDDRPWSPSPDGSRLACTAGGQDIVIVDLGTQKEIGRIPRIEPQV